MGPETRNCQNCKSDFVIEPEDFRFYEKMQVTAPTFCPKCRLQRRLTFRNERSLYRRKCDSCGKDIIAMHDPEGPIHSYCGPCWWSDKWDPLSYGKEYDFSKPFFTQLRELMEEVPHQDLVTIYSSLVNTSFTNMNHELKNCYWLFNSDYDENCFYGEEVEKSKDCMDVTMVENSELIYGSLNCSKCYQAYFSVDCASSNNVWFSKNLLNCSNCFGCVNLRGAQYCIWNEQLNKEEYLRRISEMELGSRSSISQTKDKAEKFWLGFPNKYIHGFRNNNVTGDYVYDSREVKNSHIVNGSEYCRYCLWLILPGNKDCYDLTQFGENCERVYEAMSCGLGASNLIGGINSVEGKNLFYTMFCGNSNDLFGCLSLRSKKYCILNKQYTKEEYEELLPKIKDHMNTMPYVDKAGRAHYYGDFFPTEISQFKYNETSAQEFFPLTEDDARKAGYDWRPSRERSYTVEITRKDIPDNISEVGDDIVGKTIECSHVVTGGYMHNCSTAFRIIPQELQFYRRNNLPLPDLCPNCRHAERALSHRTPIQLWNRKCQCAGSGSNNGRYANTGKHSHGLESCMADFETSYAPDRLEIVYCEACYQNEVA